MYLLVMTVIDIDKLDLQLKNLSILWLRSAKNGPKTAQKGLKRPKYSILERKTILLVKKVVDIHEMD